MGLQRRHLCAKEELPLGQTVPYIQQKYKVVTVVVFVGVLFVCCCFFVVFAKILFVVLPTPYNRK